MIARSVHPIPPPPADEYSPEANEHHEVMPRLRRVTNDPAREYAQRPGAVAPLPNSVAALILTRKGWAKIERHQIKITLDGEDLVFASRDSIVIAAKNGTGERVLWAVNRRAPELLHLLTNDGRYIESVPRKGVATWFSQDDASREAYADAQAMIQRDAARLRELHTPDTAAAADSARHNAAEIHRLVQTFPTGEQGAGREIAPASFPKADEISRAMDAGQAQHERHTERVGTDATRTASALRLGAAIRDEVFATPPPRETTPLVIEDDLTPTHPTPTQPRIIEETCP